MKSTIDIELAFSSGTDVKTLIFKAKDYPNWYGIPNIGFIWRGSWSDPYIEYKDKQFNSYIVEDTMWSRYREECDELGIDANEDDFDVYMLSHKDDVYELCDLVINGMEE